MIVADMQIGYRSVLIYSRSQLNDQWIRKQKQEIREWKGAAAAALRRSRQPANQNKVARHLFGSDVGC